MAVDCPTCGDTFDTEHGRNVHHGHVHGESLATQTSSCQHCGSEFEHYKDSKRFCSQSCHDEFVEENGEPWTEWNPKIERECKACGDTIKTWPSDDDKFCDKKCHGEWLSENQVGEDHHQYLTDEEKAGRYVLCEWCGEDTWIVPSDEENYDTHLCSRKCHARWQSEYRVGENAANYKHGNSESPYVAIPDDIRDEVIERDGGICKNCGKTRWQSIIKHKKDLTAHHIFPRSLFKDEINSHIVNNLVTLCSSCHHTIEANPSDCPVIELKT